MQCDYSRVFEALVLALLNGLSLDLLKVRAGAVIAVVDGTVISLRALAQSSCGQDDKDEEKTLSHRRAISK